MKLEPRIEHAESSEAWLRHTLEEILMQVRVLLDVDGCAFQTVDWERAHILPAAAWFETPAIRTTLRPVLDRPYDAQRGGVTEAAIEQGRPLLLRDIEHWAGAERLRARLRAQLDGATADAAWEWYRTSSFISCPVRTAGGRMLGVLALSASPPRAPLGEEHLRVTEVFANLAALALERSELLEREERRARAEELLHAAAQAMTASLDLDSVYTAIVSWVKEEGGIVRARPAEPRPAALRDAHRRASRRGRPRRRAARAPAVARAAGGGGDRQRARVPARAQGRRGAHARLRPRHPA